MITDTLAYVGTAAQLAGINRFYTRRVMQRLNRGEITAQKAAQLLIAATERGEITAHKAAELLIAETPDWWH